MQFSIIVPCFPPHFKFLEKIIEQINDFNIDEKFNIKEVIISASEADKLIFNNKCIYPVIIDTVSYRCNASANRNRGWLKASGDWIVFLDADDYYHPEKIRTTYKVIEKFPNIDCIIHSFFFKKDITLENFKHIDVDIENIEIVDNNEVKEATYPGGKYYECDINNGGCNIKTPYNKIAIHHGVISVRTNTKYRFDEKLPNGEDSTFCRKHVFDNKLVVLNSKLMIYF